MQLQLHPRDLFGPSESPLCLYKETLGSEKTTEIDRPTPSNQSRYSAPILTKTLSTKAPTFHRRPSIRRSNPEVQTLTLGFRPKSNQSVNPDRSEAIKQLRDQGGEAQWPLGLF
ncbi:hypothetical protein RHMOL_Rhmol07G0198500 [Rhododendron molle]|uniref:Uncharacterized protein n=1 Tax=Rhododendron molle TaxID=49168 RepID=A0ACC0N388_RHOML|nr:hypothetical protein RHMOL_Rhmol07G0198500 [Rhododendron molle]